MNKNENSVNLNNTYTVDCSSSIKAEDISHYGYSLLFGIDIGCDLVDV